MLTPTQVAGMRATALGALPSQATIQRLTRTPSGGGGYTEGWANLATVACRIAPMGGGERIVASAVDDRTTHVVTFPALTDVEEADRVDIDGQTFEVTVVRKRGAWEISRRVEVQES